MFINPLNVASSDAADPAPDDVLDEQPTSVTVLGLDEDQVGETIPVTELIERSEEVGQDIEDELLSGDESQDAASLNSPFVASAVSFHGAPIGIRAAADPAYSIYSQWWDNKYIKVAVRNGNSTWGWQHLQKHNVSLTMLQKTTKFPRNRYLENGSLIYVTPANQYTCWLASCRIDRTMDVKVIVNPTRLADGAPRGIITAYCVGPQVCPAWVRQVAG